jgi:hypothetical protein
MYQTALLGGSCSCPASEISGLSSPLSRPLQLISLSCPSYPFFSFPAAQLVSSQEGSTSLFFRSSSYPMTISRTPPLCRNCPLHSSRTLAPLECSLTARNTRWSTNKTFQRSIRNLTNSIRSTRWIHISR